MLKLICLVAAVLGDKARVEDLVRRMTLEEKLGQMTQLATGRLMNSDGLSLNASKVDYFVRQCHVGVFLSDPFARKRRPSPTSEEWVPIINQLQSAYQHTRLKIPMLYGMDSIHGANTVSDAALFPHQLALAASFNRTLVREVARVAAKDTRAVGVHWNYAPNLDVGVNKMWSRLYETSGEDPFLVAEMGAELIRGYQGCSLRSSRAVAATMKHFLGYSASRSGKDYDGVWASDRIVNDYFRPPFQRAVRAGVLAAMTSYSDINGEPLATSRKYLVDLLREQMGFTGALSTDFGQIDRLHLPNHVASSPKQALLKSIGLGSIDFNMAGLTADAIPLLKELVAEGAIAEATIDASVRRILALKSRLGLLDSTGHVDANRMRAARIGSREDVQKAIHAARESVVLLQNTLLPLKPSANLIVTGPAADSLRHLSGGWSYSWLAAPDDSYFSGRGTSILSGLRNLTSGSVIHAQDTVEQILAMAAGCDAIVVCVGEEPYSEAEGNINDMHLPADQLRLLDSLIQLSAKPVVVVLTQGRPRVMNPSIRKAAAVLTSFVAGPYAGQAIAEIIYGITNPSAKLPITYANHPNDNNVNYYRLVGEEYSDIYWEFGHGLSYTTFQYSALTLSSTRITPDTTITATVTVTNTGKVEGAEVVLFFISDVYRSVVPEVKKLRQFHKVNLRPRESANVSFTISREDLAFYNADNVRVVEEGAFVLTLGSTHLSAGFELILPIKDGEGMFPVPELKQ